MKTLTILLMLFTVQGMAQDNRYPKQFTEAHSAFINGYTVFEPGDTVEWVYEVPKIFITVEDLERWVKYCYNDSTFIRYTFISKDGYWQHKDPNDMPEFINWLKENK